jgi:branched-chain amino acid transport system ATP-binding protein
MDETSPLPPSLESRILNFDDPLGATWLQFGVLTVVVFGFAAFMMGWALADTWRPVWQVVLYGLLLGVGNRLFQNFLCANDVLNLVAYVIGAAVLIAIAQTAYRAIRAHKMVTQYPWLYQRAGLFSWRQIS